MKKPILVKDIIELINADRVEIVEIHHPLGKEPYTIQLWHFDDADQNNEYLKPEVKEREVMRVFSRGQGEIWIEVFK